MIGWFQGRFEFGPRALGSRSILADPRSEGMPNILNRKIKNREAFRPFAPIVKREVVSDYFEIDADSPYMLLVAPVRRERRKVLSAEQLQRFGPDLLNVARSDLPAVTHVDYSARLQTVTRQSNPRLYSLLDAFQESTEYPVLINTSFNVRDEPVVNSPVEAYRCFMQTAMDALVLGNHLLEKKQQNVLYHELKVSFKESDDDFVIAVLGESTAYGLPYGPSINIASLASFALAGEVDGRKIRVLNLAKPGQPSAGVLKGIKQLPRKVDVVLLYCGQNEFYAQHLYPHDLTCSQRRLVDVPLQSSRKRRRTIEQFELNITRIINECTARGAKVVISTLAQNLARRWPNRSTIKNRRHASQVETLFQQGEHLASHGDHDAAAVVMQEILQMEPGFAAAHKLLGDCFLATKRYGEAIRAYEASVTHDAFPSIGIDEQNEIIRRLVCNLGAGLIDAATIFAEKLEEGKYGYDLFHDEVHPNLEGYSLIGVEFAKHLAGADSKIRQPAVAELKRAFLFDHQNETDILVRSTIDALHQSTWTFFSSKVLSVASRFIAEAIERREPKDVVTLMFGVLTEAGLGNMEKALMMLRQAIREDELKCAA